MDKNHSDLMALRRKSPVPLLIYFWVGIPSILFALYVSFTMHIYEPGIIMLVGGGALLLLLFLNDRGYQLAYDDTQLYSRDWDFGDWFRLHRKSWHSIAFVDMAAIEGKFHPRAAGMASLVPFQYLEVSSKRRDEKDIWIYPEALKSKDLFCLYDHIYAHRPDIVPEVLLNMMNKRHELQ